MKKKASELFFSGEWMYLDASEVINGIRVVRMMLKNGKVVEFKLRLEKDKIVVVEDAEVEI